MSYLAELKHITKIYSRGRLPDVAIKNLEPVSFPAHTSHTGVSVLYNVSLQIRPNESVAITGPSGSGKTTLLNILGTLDRPTSGDVILNGNPSDRMSPDQLAAVRNRMIGFVFQLHYLLPQFTLLENILLPTLPVKDSLLRKSASERAYELLEKVGLKDRINDRPAFLSTGECQRAAVVRALINHPALLLADEPTGSLDRENADRLGELLVKLKAEYGLSIIVVTHSTELAKRMEKIYTLSSGALTLTEHTLLS